MPAETSGATIVKVKFFPKAVYNEIKTEKDPNGVKRYDRHTYLSCEKSDGTMWIRPAHKWDEERYPEEFKAFKEGRESDNVGTPLTEISGIAPDEIETLKAAGFGTIETLSLARSVDAEMLGERYVALRDFAQSHLRSRKSTEEVVHMRSQMEAKDAEILAMKKLLAKKDLLTEAEMESFLKTGEVPEAIQSEIVEESDPEAEPESEDEDLGTFPGQPGEEAALQPFSPSERRTEDPEGDESAGDDLFATS